MKIKRLNELLKSEKEERELEEIIQKLKDIEIDGEYTQYLLRQIDMEDQMLRQLIKSYPYIAMVEFLSFDDSYKLDEVALGFFEKNPEAFDRLEEFIIKLKAKKYNL